MFAANKTGKQGYSLLRSGIAKEEIRDLLRRVPLRKAEPQRETSLPSHRLCA